MRTRNSYFPNNSSVTILRRRNKKRTPNVVEPELRTIVEVAPMADNSTMEELLQAPTKGYEEAIVIPEINADHFEIKTIFLQLKVVTPAPVKAVEESCVTCGGPHAHYNCDATNRNQPSVYVATGTYNQVAPQNRASNYMAPPGFAPVQISQNRFNQNQGRGNNFNRENNFHVNRIDIIDVAREEYAQEMLGFSNNSSGGNPTLTSEPILSDSSPSLTPFKGSEFILEEIKAYLTDESISPKIDHADCDPEGDIYLIEKLLNDDPFQLPPMDLKEGEVVKAKSSIEEPLELELKELPSHLEYAYLEGVDKLPVIIAKDLKVNEKEALLKVLKSHKRAIAWKISDIKGIDPCTHKILMEEDYKPAVQSQRRVNAKIH
nr:reverse transcriptase domain-containing protein [Tanacetum cinerariifolium]